MDVRIGVEPRRSDPTCADPTPPSSSLASWLDEALSGIVLPMLALVLARGRGRDVPRRRPERGRHRSGDDRARRRSPRRLRCCGQRCPGGSIRSGGGSRWPRPRGTLLLTAAPALATVHPGQPLIGGRSRGARGTPSRCRRGSGARAAARPREPCRDRGNRRPPSSSAAPNPPVRGHLERTHLVRARRSRRTRARSRTITRAPTWRPGSRAPGAITLDRLDGETAGPLHVAVYREVLPHGGARRARAPRAGARGRGPRPGCGAGAARPSPGWRWRSGSSSRRTPRPTRRWAPRSARCCSAGSSGAVAGALAGLRSRVGWSAPSRRGAGAARAGGSGYTERRAGGRLDSAFVKDAARAGRVLEVRRGARRAARSGRARPRARARRRGRHGLAADAARRAARSGPAPARREERGRARARVPRGRPGRRSPRARARWPATPAAATTTR